MYLAAAAKGGVIRATTLEDSLYLPHGLWWSFHVPEEVIRATTLEDSLYLPHGLWWSFHVPEEVIRATTLEDSLYLPHGLCGPPSDVPEEVEELLLGDWYLERRQPAAELRLPNASPR